MVTLRFLPSGYACAAEAGERIVDVTDAHPRAEVPYSCRAASCATCRVRVLEGTALLSAPAPDEREVLEIMDEPADVRLACQLVVVGREGRVVLEVVAPA